MTTERRGAQSELDAASELALLSFAARLLLSQLDRRLLLERGLECFLDFARGRAGAVFLLDAAGERLRLVAGGTSELAGGAEVVLPAGESPWREALAGRMPRSFARAGRECLCVPLVGVANRVLGVVTIDRDGGGPLEEARMQSLLVLQSILALGLEQAAARERLLEANEELEGLYAAKGKMIDHLSHELKTPLAVLGASTALLGRSSVRHDDARSAAVLERMGRGLERLLELQEEARDIAEAEAPVAVPAQAIALERWVPEVLASIAPLHRHRGVRLETALEASPPLVLPEALLRKAVIGLVRNAIEATPDGRWVRVAVSSRAARGSQAAGGETTRSAAATEREETKASAVVLEVVDSGVGFDQAASKLLFHGFVHAGHTADYSSRRPYDFGAGGRGLDLLRTRHFADHHGFAIEVESEPGRGSRFRLVFPPPLLGPAETSGGAPERASSEVVPP